MMQEDKLARAHLGLYTYRAQGLTLIEILVTLGIMVLLAVLLLPMLTMARTSARTAMGLSNLRQIATGFGTYGIDHEELFPLGFDDRSPYAHWASSLSPYLSANQKTTFPDFLSLISSPLGKMFLDPNVKHTNSPDDAGFTRNLDYSGHLHLLGSTASGISSPYRFDQVKRTSEMMLVTDATQYLKPPPVPALYVLPTAKNVDVGSTPFYDPASIDNESVILPGPNTDSSNSSVLGYIRWRQFNDTAANMLFVDGHASATPMTTMRYRNVRADPK